MRWPWQRRRAGVVALATRELREAQGRLQRARGQTEAIEAAAERVAELPAGELVRRLGIAFSRPSEHD
jgi:hypothetical protein